MEKNYHRRLREREEGEDQEEDGSRTSATGWRTTPWEQEERWTGHGIVQSSVQQRLTDIRWEEEEDEEEEEGNRTVSHLRTVPLPILRKMRKSYSILNMLARERNVM